MTYFFYFKTMEQVLAYVMGTGGAIIVALIGLVYANLTAKIAENNRLINENFKNTSERLDRKNIVIQEIIQKNIRLESEQTFQTKGLDSITNLINRRFDDVEGLLNDKIELALSRKQGKANGN